MRNIIYVLSTVLALGSAAKGYAQKQDTTTLHLKTVEVFGKPAEVYAVGSQVTYLDSSFLSTYRSSSLAGALQARSPLFIKSYGASGISTVTFRGTNASHTAVLWNGLAIGSPTLGQADFSVLPLTGIGDLALQHGAAGASYGSGAIGGAVLISSPQHKQDGFGGTAQIENGSFGHYAANGTIGYGNEHFQAQVGIYGQHTENDFKFKDVSRAKAPVTTQEHAAHKLYGFTQDLNWQVNNRTKLAVHTWYTASDREVQPAMGSAYNSAEQQDKNLRLMAELAHDSRLGNTSVKAAFFNDYLNFSDSTSSSEADVNTYQLQAEHTYAKANKWSLRGGLNLQHFVAANAGYTGIKEESRAAAFALFRYDPNAKLKLSANLRQAFVTGYNPSPTPALGFEWKLFKQSHHHISWRGNTAASFKVPTLNDRFWQGAGNPNLRPEQGWNYETGLRHVWVKDNSLLLETDAAVFYMLINDWIQWAPEQSGRWRPVNLQQVVSRGFEGNVHATTQIGQVKASSNLAYSYTQSYQNEVYEGEGNKGKQLMYVPRHKATLSTDAKYKGWTLANSLNFTGLRYTNNSESSSLGSFLLLSIALNKQIKLNNNLLVLSLRSENVTNTVYETMAYRAMPPRSYQASLRFIIP